MINYPLKFKAAILEKNGDPLKIREIVFNGPLLKGQVLVKLFYSGICGKQIEEIDGLGGEDKFIPHLLGHEGVGEVFDLGPEVKKVKIQDKVVLHWMKGGGINSETPLYHFDKKRINAGWVTTFNEYAVVSENRVTPIPLNNNLKTSALFGCAVTTGVGTSLIEAEIKPEDSVIIFGCGGVGLFALQGAKLMSPKKLIAIDINDESLELAKKFGATDILNPLNCNIKKEVELLTQNKGCEKVIITTGNKNAIEMAIELCSIPGECIQVGVPTHGEKISINAHALMHKRNLSGSLGGGTFPDKDIPKFMELNNEGKINVESMIRKEFPFNKINEAIVEFRGKTPGRILIKF